MQQHLQQGLAALGMQLAAQQESDLLGFIELLQRWNKTFNLTAIRDPLEMISRHLFDSLSVGINIDFILRVSTLADEPVGGSGIFAVFDFPFGG